MRERLYQVLVVKRLRDEFPGCLILKNDSSYLQGIPDYIILYLDRWAMLEIKADGKSAFQPNQAYYVSELNHMSFAAFIFPEIEDAVFHDLHRALDRNSRRHSPRKATG